MSLAPSSLYKTFAVAGGLSGTSVISVSLGAHIARALIREGGQVKILGRASAMLTPAAKELSSLGVSITQVDYASPSSLAEALKGVDVVISALGGPGLAFQPALAEASKVAGIKLFLPSEFGGWNGNQSADSPLYGKTLFQAKIKEMGLSYLILSSGAFADLVSPVCISDVDNEIIIVGDGKKDISWTSVPDVASFVAHILTHLPPSQLINQTLAIEGSRASLLSLAQHLLARNPSAKIVHQTPESALKRWKEERNFLGWLKAHWDEGKGVVKVDEGELNNGLWEDWKPRKVEEFL